ncbi:hypothetical protein ACM0A0_24475 [Mycobacteroides abscessus subsp. abscessus]|uniref:hypothetical protein n=1 Tax=Mycobacteroides abscessus TaxID=36809 RepID=UPI0039EEA887
MSKLEEKKLNKGPDLSDLNKPGRGEGLADLIPPPPEAEASAGQPTPSTSAPTEGPANKRSPDLPDIGPADAEADTPEAPAEPETQASSGSKQKTRTGNDKDLGAVYVSENVRKRFDKYRHDNRLTNAQVVRKAVSTLHSELPEVIAAARYSTEPEDPLFPADPSAVKYAGGGSAQIVYATTPEQSGVLDAIGKQIGFSTRSTWLAPVLNAFLPGRKDRAPASA